jgi:hypothetical protein
MGEICLHRGRTPGNSKPKTIIQKTKLHKAWTYNIKTRITQTKQCKQIEAPSEGTNTLILSLQYSWNKHDKFKKIWDATTTTKEQAKIL